MKGLDLRGSVFDVKNSIIRLNTLFRVSLNGSSDYFSGAGIRAGVGT